MRPTKSSHSFQVKGQEVKFSSNFDSGNLRTVTQTGVHQFLVESSHDTYETPTSNKSFFHFRIQNYPLNEPIKIVIQNLSLLDCIKTERRIHYRPCYSYNGHDYQRLSTGCSRIIQGEDGLSLQISMVITKNVIYLSFALPYSYERYLNMVRDLPESNDQIYIKKQVLCYSKNLHLVYMITITSYDKRTNGYDQIGCTTNGVILPEKHLDQSRVFFDKPVILLSARVHPGETPSSWAFEGIIKFLLGSSEQAKTLRKNFQIIIVPMLNPDGVFEGMYRLDTQGHNLNRYYLISDNRQPSIYSMKHLIKHYNATKRLLFYFDFHGHPSFKGSFLYGNAIDDIAYQAQTELFGRILSLKCDTFEQKYCIFDRQQMSSKDKFDMYTKQGCARVYAFKTANILHSYTVQMGFHGCTEFPSDSTKQISSFCYTQNDYYSEGIAVMVSVLQASSLISSGIDKKLIRKQIALEILTREQRFRKQDKHVNSKKKNVNQIIQNQYWGPIRSKYFKTIPNASSASKFRRLSIESKKKAVSISRRTSFMSSTCTHTVQIDTQQHKVFEEEKTIEKRSTQNFQSIDSKTISKNYIQNKKKRIQMRHIIFSTKKRKNTYIEKKQEIQSHTEIKKFIDREKIIQMEKITDKLKKHEIKIHAGKSKFIDTTQIIKSNQGIFEDIMFNDVNLRKSDAQIAGSSNYIVTSADKICPSVEQFRDIFKSDAIKQNLSPTKINKTYKKYSMFFG